MIGILGMFCSVNNVADGRSHHFLTWFDIFVDRIIYIEKGDIPTLQGSSGTGIELGSV